MDSRTSSILINLDLNLNTGLIANQYTNAVEGIKQSEKGNSKKVYKNLRAALKESYLTSSLRYGNGFIS